MNNKLITWPWLLAPTCDAITLCWECEKLLPVTLHLYGESGEHLSYIVQGQAGAPWGHQQIVTGFYRCRVEGLKPDTRWRYHLEIAGESCAEGQFKMLQQAPESVKFVWVSDTHEFAVHEGFSAAVQRHQPDFILHGGDLLMGSAMQKDQYQNWFMPQREILAQYPVLYIKGNHDDGVYFDDYFAVGQQALQMDNVTGQGWRFDYGPLQLLHCYSNPWSLALACTEQLGEAPSQQLSDTISGSLAWAESQLQAMRQTNKWCFATSHHHYLDDNNRKYLAPLLERYHTDIVLMGHVHAWQHMLGSNGHTWYLASGAACQPAETHQLIYASGGELPFGMTPEMLCLGDNDYSVVTVTEERIEITLWQVGNTEPLATLYREKNVAEPQVTAWCTDRQELNYGEPLQLQASLINTAPYPQPLVLPLKINGKPAPQTQFHFTEDAPARVGWIMAQETRDVCVQLLLTTAGGHQLTLGNQSLSVTVLPSPARLAVHQSQVVRSDAPNDNQITVFAELENAGSIDGDFVLTLCIGQQIVTSQIQLKGGERCDFKQTLTCTGVGECSVTLNGQSVGNIYIPYGLQVVPKVRDRSGNGHDAWLYGKPVLCEGDQGLALHLDGQHDYVEIPDHPRLRIQQGVTALIEAKVNSLQGRTRFDHFPLIGKGPSLVAGPNYQMRLAIRDSGWLTGAVSYNSDEHYWDGGSVNLRHWSHYGVGFNKQQGGRIWRDGEQVGEIGGIDEPAEIRDWPGYPLRIGYANMGYLDAQRKRAKYYSLFSLDLRSLRFYLRLLSTEEVQKSLTTAEAMPEIWLDFTQPEVCASYHSHRIAVAEAFKLQLQCQIADQSQVVAQVMLYDANGEVYGVGQRITLHSGVNNLEQTLPPSVVTMAIQLELNGVMVPGETQLPWVEQMSLCSKGRTWLWHSAVDWRTQGELKGAAGFTDYEVLRELVDDKRW